MKAFSIRKAAVYTALVIAAGLFAYGAMPEQPRPAPTLVYSTVKGELVTPADLYGKVTLVNFWATDCMVCMKEMPRLVQTYNRLRPLGLQTVAVAMSYDRPDRVLEYAEKNRLPFKVALDVRGEAARQFGTINATPTTFLIDKRGNIVKSWQGEPDYAKLERLIEQKLAERV